MPPALDLAETKENIWMADLLGRQFGNYVLVRLLGEGSFAQVYLGEHIYLRTQAAVKVLASWLDADQLEVFRQEAGQSARLEHPNIVRVLEAGNEDQTPFLVMQYAPNGTLRQRHSPGHRLAPEAILPYVRQVAAALHYLHDQHLAHRGVKPENLLLGRHQEVLLSDFGLTELALRSHTWRRQGRTGAMVYLAPEYVQGRAGPASDQYALGVVIYEWLTGERLSAESDAGETLTQPSGLPLPPLRSRVPMLSPEVEWVVMQALAPVPQQRFVSVQAFATAFEHACQVEQEIGPGTRAQPLPLTSPAVRLVSLPQTPGSASVPGVSTQPDQPTAPTHPAPLSGPVPARKRLVSRRSFLLTLAGVTAVGAGATGLALVSHLQSGHRNTRQPTATPIPPGTLLLTYTGHPDGVVAVAWSPDGTKIASAGAGGEALIWNAATGSTMLSYSVSDGGTNVSTIAWSPDGSSIASGGNDETVRVWRSATGSRFAAFPDSDPNSNGIASVAWSPNGQWLTAANETDAVVVLDAPSLRLARTHRQPGDYVVAAAWSPESTTIASGGYAKSVAVWKALTGDAVTVFSGHTDVVYTVAWSPDGTLIASGGMDGSVRVWDTGTGQPLHFYQDAFQVVHQAAWSPDGKRIAIASGKQVLLWDWTAGKVVYTYHGHTDEVYTLAWSPDGTRIASGSGDRTVQIWWAGNG